MLRLSIAILILQTHRPRGVPHPIDLDSPSTVRYRRAIVLLGKRLAFFGDRRLWLRLESVGTMFLSAFIQHSVHREELKLPVDELFEDTIEMMAAALVCPPMTVGGE